MTSTGEQQDRNRSEGCILLKLLKLPRDFSTNPLAIYPILTDKPNSMSNFSSKEKNILQKNFLKIVLYDELKFFVTLPLYLEKGEPYLGHALIDTTICLVCINTFYTHTTHQHYPIIIMIIGASVAQPSLTSAPKHHYHHRSLPYQPPRYKCIICVRNHPYMRGPKIQTFNLLHRKMLDCHTRQQPPPQHNLLTTNLSLIFYYD